MVEINSIVRFLNKELKIKKIKDSSRNGLQVKGKNEVRKVGLAVDACLTTLKKVKKAKVDLLIVHHGIKWKPQKRKEVNDKREKFAKKNKISLYGVHLPLDSHYKYGNNIGLCNILELIKTKKFGKYPEVKVGYSGEFKKPVGINRIKDILDSELKTKCMVYAFGKKNIKTIGIVSGGGLFGIEDALKEKLDCFLTGDMNLGAYHWAKDAGLNLVIAGHYATETVGVKLLMKLIKEKFDVNTIFIENKMNL